MSNPTSLPRLPDETKRTLICGQNGTGKTVAGIWHLSRQNYDRMPWIICNYKRDENLDEIPGVIEIDHNAPLPKSPGLYMVRPEPVEGSLDLLLTRAHAQTHVGVYIDEGYMVGNNSKPYRTVLTQGRSLRVPCITLTQRPVWISRFAFSEAQFFQVFDLVDAEDRKSVNRFVPLNVNYPETLGEYESYYFDAGKKRLAKLGPVPFGEEVLDVFDRRRPRRVRRVG